MSRVAALTTLFLALALAGCGGGDDDEEGTSRIETSAPPSQFEPEEPAPSLASTIAVADLAGTPTAEPRRLEFSSDASLEGIRWRDWGSPRALGTGTARILLCRPTCGQGKVRSLAAEVTLSDPVSCDGQRYYGSATVQLTHSGKPAPASFVEAPC